MNNKLNEVVAALKNLLPDTFGDINHDCPLWLEILSGGHLVLRLDERRKRVEACGTFSFGPQRQHVKPSSYPDISASSERSAEAIAKDIIRRWLPDYVERYAECKATFEAEQNYKNDTATTETTAESACKALTCYTAVRASGLKCNLEFHNLSRANAVALLSFAKGLGAGAGVSN